MPPNPLSKCVVLPRAAHVASRHANTVIPPLFYKQFEPPLPHPFPPFPPSPPSPPPPHEMEILDMPLGRGNFLRDLF